MMDDIKKAVTQMFCVKMALIASQSAAAVVLHIKWQAFYELLAMASAKPNPKSLFLSRASMAPYGLKKKNATVFSIVVKGYISLCVVKVKAM